MNNTELFLQEYAKTESLLKRISNLPDTVLDYETLLDPDSSEKLRLCRQIRNYSRHHEDYRKFIEVAPGMLKFIQDLNYTLESSFEHVSDRTRRIKPLELSSTVSEAIAAVAKSPVGFVPLVDEVVIGIVSERFLIEILANEARKTAKLKSFIQDPSFKKQKYSVVDADLLLSEMKDEGFVVVVSKGKYRGVFVK